MASIGPVSVPPLPPAMGWRGPHACPCTYCGFGIPGQRPVCQCRRAAYCDALCQKRYWDVHRVTCSWIARVRFTKVIIKQLMPGCDFPNDILTRILDFAKGMHVDDL